MANETLHRVTIPWKNEDVAIFYFDKEEEAEEFGKDVKQFVHGIASNSDELKDTVYNKYKKIKPYRLFFKAMEMRIKGSVVSEERKVE